MDGLVTAGVVIPLVLGLGLVIFFVVARVRKERRRREAVSHKVSVAELLEKAAEQGHPIRLNWSAQELDASGWVRPAAHDERPTAVLPLAIRKSEPYGHRAK